MTAGQSETQGLAEEVVNRELEMFLEVRPLIPSLCQERPETFKLMRRASHYTLSADTLKSYLADLVRAREEGQNLLAEKYARMDDLRPRTNYNPHIEEIVQIEMDWLQELARKYPHTFQGRSDYTAGVYLRSELETMSDRTLELYSADVAHAREEGRNLAGETYAFIMRELGYSSLAEVEERHARRS